MARPEQKSLTLAGGLQATYASATTSLLDIVRDIDANECPKRSALVEEAGIKSESFLSEVLNGKGKNFPLYLLPMYVRHDQHDRIAGEVARWKGLRCVPLRPRSAAEQLARLVRVLDQMGPTGDFIRERAAALPDDDDEVSVVP